MEPPEAPVPDVPVEPAPPERRSWRSTLYDLALETFAVGLGITAALAVGNWQADRADRAKAARAHTSLVEELRANRALVDESRAYHQGLLDSLRAHYAARRGAVSPRLFTRGFVHPATPSSTAWEAATSTGALELLDYADVLALSRAYAAQENYRESSRTAGQIVYQALYASGTEGVAGEARRLVPLIASSMYLETQLVAELDSALASVSDRP